MKKKRTYTRRQRAIRWLTALLIVLLIGHFTNTFHLLPSHSIEAIAQQRVLEDMEIVHSQWGKYSPMAAKRLYTSQNEQQILVSAAAFHPMLGWYPFGPGLVLDRNDPKSCNATWTASKDDQVWVCLAGFVPEGETPPTYSVGLADNRYSPDPEYLLDPDQVLTITPTADISVNGGTFYLETYSLSRHGKSQYISVFLNKDGHLSQVENWLSTSVG